MTTRRELLGSGARFAAGSALVSSAWTPVDAPAGEGGGARPLGVALVGLGSLSTNQLAPALGKTKHCRLAGVVTGTSAKEERWAEHYGLRRENI